MFRYWFVLFSYPDFYGTNKTCDQVFDSDVAGIGVVSSIVIAAVLTTLLAICAPFLDGIAGYGLDDDPHGCEGLLPRKLNERLFRRYKDSNIRGYDAEFFRKVLTRVMLTLADQQILTGIAILVSGYVRAWQIQNYGDYFPKWRYRLIENHFFLIVYMACLSSSSHLAAVVTLKRHLSEHRVLAFIRLSLIVVFALLLTVTICLAVPFGLPTVFYLRLDEDIPWKETYFREYVLRSDGSPYGYKSNRSLLALFYIVAVIAILYPYWIAIVNTFEKWEHILKKLLKKFWSIQSRWLPMHWTRKSFNQLEKVWPAKFRKGVRRALKDTFWYLVLGNTGRAFCWQLIFFCLSLTYVIAQRAANVQETNVHEEEVKYCDLSSGGTSWGFGQILPMLLLVFPIISAVVAFFEVRADDKKKNQPTEVEMPLRQGINAV